MSVNRAEARRRVLVAAHRNRAERDAAVALLERAAAALATGTPISPEGLREPVRHHMRAAAELCRGARSIWGLPVVYALEMAAAITAELVTGGVGEVVSGGQGADHDQPGGDQRAGG